MTTAKMVFTGCMFLIAGALAVAEGDNKAAVPMCPVMADTPASMFLSVDSDQGPVYMCCKGCVKRYKRNPDKYASEVKAQRDVLAKLPKMQVLCPVSGDTVDTEVSLEHKGEKVQFCCGGCKSKFEAEPAKYTKQLAKSYTYQTQCPIMDSEISPGVYSDLPTGERVYYCCKMCKKRMLKNPEKYDAKLVAQNIRIDWERVKAKKGS
ncbi:MAG: hypothetical protein ACPGXK_03645 [Phycisphaerae bacterium]